MGVEINKDDCKRKNYISTKCDNHKIFILVIARKKRNDILSK